MNVFVQAWHWLTTSGHWSRNTDNSGVLQLAWEHIQIAAVSVFFAAVIGLSVGITLGHYRRGGAIVDTVVTRKPAMIAGSASGS